MERRSRRPYSAEFTPKQKREAKERAGNVCYSCGLPADSPLHQCILEVHHGRPVAHNGTRDPENAVVEGKGYCHQLLDHLALNYGIYFTMEEGEEYEL